MIGPVKPDEDRPRRALERNLGPIVLGDHRLDLEPEILGGVVAVGVALERHFDPAPGKLLTKAHVVAIVSA